MTSTTFRPKVMTSNGATSTMSGSPSPGGGRRKRGRPAMMTHDQLVESIRALAARPDGLYRVHLTDADLYSRARRYFGSWAAAVAAAGVDYHGAVSSARQRSLHTRRHRR